MAAENRKLKVFLCHSKDDKPKVRELYRRLVADGFDAWLDEEKLMPGQDWDLEIRKAVRETDVVLVCLSQGSVTKSGYVQKEIKFALDVADEQPEGAIFLIPARLEDCEVPSRLIKWQWVNLFEEKGRKQLAVSLNLRANALRSVSYLTFDFEPEMIRIPDGKFLMGTTKKQTSQAIKDGIGNQWIIFEQPQHTVELSEYYIGKYPITNREYQVFVRGAIYKPPRNWDSALFPAEKGEHPVTNVSWNDATTYCKWLSERSGKKYRLPTEAEWEKAARGEDGRVYPWGNNYDSTKANISETKLGETTVVGNFSPQGDSPYGCTDMAGNVWEWCNDWFDEDEYQHRRGAVAKDPQGPQTGQDRVLRGGSFYDDHGYIRCTYRGWNNPNSIFWNRGFRVAYSL